PTDSDATESMAAIIACPHTAPLDNLSASFCGNIADTMPGQTLNSRRPSIFTQGAKTYSYNSRTVASVWQTMKRNRNSRPPNSQGRIEPVLRCLLGHKSPV